MPSRKRAKGKARKARAKEASSSSPSSQEQLNQPPQANPSSVCDHGYPLTIPPICEEFIDAFFDSLRLNEVSSIFVAMEMTEAKYPDVGKNATLMVMIKSIFVSSAIEAILRKGHDPRSEDVLNCFTFTGIVLAFENAGGDLSLAERCTAIEKHRDLHDGGDHAAVKYLSKHATCSCLKPILAELKKSTPKLACCYQCDVSLEASKVMVCSKCKFSLYCSKKCQKAAWPKHRKRCQLIVESKNGRIDSLREEVD